MSIWPQCSARRPSFERMTSIASHSTDLPVGSSPASLPPKCEYPAHRRRQPMKAVEPGARSRG